MSTLNQETLDLSLGGMNKSRVVRLASAIEWIFKEFKSKANEKNPEFFFDNQIDDGAVKVDKPLIVKAVSNLVENAIKYTEEG